MIFLGWTPATRTAPARRDVEVGECTGALKGNKGQTSALGWLLDDTANVILSGAQDGHLRVWDARAGARARVHVDGHTPLHAPLATPQASSYPLPHYAPGVVAAVWRQAEAHFAPQLSPNLPAGPAPQHQLHLHPGGAVTEVKSTFFHDMARGNLVVTAGADQTIKVLDPRYPHPQLQESGVCLRSFSMSRGNPDRHLSACRSISQ